MERTIIAVPMGDPAGIGPEIVAKAMAGSLAGAPVVVAGSGKILELACRACGVSLRLRPVRGPEEAVFAPGTIELIEMNNVEMENFRFGAVSGMCGAAAFQYIEECIRLAMDGRVSAVTTTPINKESFRAGGVNFIGHTEIFGALTGSDDPLTMFEVRGLRVFFLTRHVSLREACGLVKKERIIDYVKRCTGMLRQLGVAGGTMAVAGLNPHSGEHGLFGTEEMEEVIPAVEELRRQGYQVEGPIGADSVFHQALQGKYNSVLSLYHDQGHIACKTLDFERTVSVTGGMPILRTSVDHGTAFDIAGKGIASEVSMVEAVRVAEKYAPHFGVKR